MKNEKSTKTSAPGRQGGLNAEVQARIGHQLRAMYNDVVKQGVPDRFAAILREIDAKGNEGAAQPAPSETDQQDTSTNGRS